MAQTTHFYFDGVNAPVAFQNCDEVSALLPRVALRWPSRVGDPPAAGRQPFLTISRFERGYRLISSFMPKPIDQPDAVNAVCAMVVELAWALLRDQTQLLCLHCAAIEFDGHLVVLPSTRRSGKSLLTASLAAAGYRVFTDDFLPLERDEFGRLHGIACGIAPRLRLPLPDDMNSDTAEWITLHAGPANRQYTYLDLPEAALAPNGARLPIGAVVLLDRREGVATGLTTALEADVLKSLIVQNFARGGRSDTILKTLDALVGGSSPWHLTYARADDAVEALRAEFSSLSRRFAGTRAIDNTAAPLPVVASGRYDPSASYVQASGVTEVGADDTRFLADPNGVAVHQLSALSVGIWRMLAEPVGEAEIASILTTAFPDQPLQRVAQDVNQFLKKLAAANLIVPARPNS